MKGHVSDVDSQIIQNSVGLVEVVKIGFTVFVIAPHGLMIYPYRLMEVSISTKKDHLGCWPKTVKYGFYFMEA